MKAIPIFALVDSGQQVADFPVRFGNEAALYCPAVDSCTAAIKAAWDPTSANFRPLKVFNAPSPGGLSQTSLADIVLPVGAGGAHFALDCNLAAGLPYALVVLADARTAPRTLAMAA